jgi:hypothetical protein
MSRQALLKALVRLALAWAMLTTLASVLGPQMLVSLRPALQWTVEQLLPGMITSISISPRPGEDGDVTMDLQAVRPVPIAGDYVVTPFVKVQERINAGHDLVPAIILIAVLLAWPHRSLGQGLRGLACGLVVATVLVAWMGSVHFAGLYEISLQRVAASFHEAREVPFFLTQMLFFESGGQWLIALVSAIAIGLGLMRKSPAGVMAGEALDRRRPLVEWSAFGR